MKVSFESEKEAAEFYEWAFSKEKSQTEGAKRARAALKQYRELMENHKRAKRRGG
jgi:hypothetical protein